MVTFWLLAVCLVANNENTGGKCLHIYVTSNKAKEAKNTKLWAIRHQSVQGMTCWETNEGMQIEGEELMKSESLIMLSITNNNNNLIIINKIYIAPKMFLNAWQRKIETLRRRKKHFMMSFESRTRIGSSFQRAGAATENSRHSEY